MTHHDKQEIRDNWPHPLCRTVSIAVKGRTYKQIHTHTSQGGPNTSPFYCWGSGRSPINLNNTLSLFSRLKMYIRDGTGRGYTNSISSCVPLTKIVVHALHSEVSPYELLFTINNLFFCAVNKHHFKWNLYEMLTTNATRGCWWTIG